MAGEARRRGFKRLGILGTRYLMEGPVYPSKLTSAGIERRVPNLEQRERINQIIYDELVNARILPESRAYFQNVIRDLAVGGCDAVALSCTEIPLLISPADSPLPVLDSTRILARAALRKAISTRPLPLSRRERIQGEGHYSATDFFRLRFKILARALLCKDSLPGPIWRQVHMLSEQKQNFELRAKNAR